MASNLKATPVRVAKAEKAAALITFRTYDDRIVEGQIVDKAPAPKSFWVIPVVPTGREFQGCLTVREHDGRYDELGGPGYAYRGRAA